MIRRTLLLFWCAAAAQAEPARVMSGEHDDFTRLVIELPERSAWTLGRTPMGYGFAAPDSPHSGYDLSRVWDRIPRTRLQALRHDPVSGALFLTLACACHVIPFEYGPDMIVLDIRNGPAPEGSEFEAAFRGGDALPAPPQITLPVLRPSPSDYSWIELPRRPVSSGDPAPDIPLPTDGVSLDLLRDALLFQISRGAAEGIVDMRLPADAPGAEPEPAEDFPWSHIRIGDLPGLGTGSPDPDERGLPPASACLSDDRLNLPTWGSDAPATEQLAAARSGLMGEFDRVDSAAVQAAVRVHLYLGFGAEAAQYAGLLQGSDIADEVAVYLSLARLVDGQRDPESPFRDMLACGGRAALWAALAAERLPQDPLVDSAAIVRSFQELPAHLRAFLGPDLAKKFLDRDDPGAARVIRDTLARLPGYAAADVALLDAKAALHAERPAMAREEAARALQEGEWEPGKLIALVAAHARDTQPLSPDVADALLAFAQDAQDAAQAKEIRTAATLALALSGRSALALDIAAEHGLPTGDLWALVVGLAPDDAFLRHAVVGRSAPVPAVAPATAQAAAERLLNLGFARAALAWLGPVSLDDPVEKRRLSARAELAEGAASAALARLVGLSEPADHTLRAKALEQLGRLDEARQAYLAAGLEAEADRIQRWQGDWANVGTEEDGPWLEAVTQLGPAVPDGTAGPLAQARALIDDSATVRAAIDRLLAEVPIPQP